MKFLHVYMYIHIYICIHILLSPYIYIHVSEIVKEPTHARVSGYACHCDDGEGFGLSTPLSEIGRDRLISAYEAL